MPLFPIRGKGFGRMILRLKIWLVNVPPAGESSDFLEYPVYVCVPEAARSALSLDSWQMAAEQPLSIALFS